MPVQVALNTPLADALSQAVQPKLVEIGWGSGGAEDAALAEYIILMLINGKTEQEIANDISGELLNLGPDDPAAADFARWLFQEIEALDAQLNGRATEAQGDAAMPSATDTTMDTAGEVSELNAYVHPESAPIDKRKLTRLRPTGPKSMRNGSGSGARGREKRMFGQMNRAMDRSQDVLRRVRVQSGNERINRGPPTGPRAGQIGRQPRNVNLQGGFGPMGQPSMQQMPGVPGMMPNGMEGWNANMGNMNPGSMDPTVLAMFTERLQQQNDLMQKMAQQLSNQNNGFQNRRGRERGNHRGGGYNRGHHHQSQPKNATSEQTVEMEMDGTKPEPANPEESVCKFNLKCNNKDCKFAHQSPVAPPGTTVDVKDVCTFGAACKNFKCTARHPSPAARVAYQSDQDCKFFPNCQNPQCQFRHPAMPLCRNGPSCSTPNCKFTHVRTKCKFKPCLNPACAFVHDEGQQGGFKDKVWTPDSQKDHVSDRKFVDEMAETEMVIPSADEDATIS